jgi:hypothetical protein
MYESFISSVQPLLSQPVRVQTFCLSHNFLSNSLNKLTLHLKLLYSSYQIIKESGTGCADILVASEPVRLITKSLAKTAVGRPNTLVNNSFNFAHHQFLVPLH